MEQIIMSKGVFALLPVLPNVEDNTFKCLHLDLYFIDNIVQL